MIKLFNLPDRKSLFNQKLPHKKNRLKKKIKVKHCEREEREIATLEKEEEGSGTVVA